MLSWGTEVIKIIPEAATASHSHNTPQRQVSPHFPNEGAWLSHTTHYLSMGVAICITICVSHPHSGLNIIPAGLRWLIQTSLKLLPRIIQHTAHPSERRTQREPWWHFPTGYMEQYKNISNTKQGWSMDGWSVVMTDGVLQTASHLVSERERAP